MMTRPDYKTFILSSNKKGSGKATSYLAALDMLGEILALSKGPFREHGSIWAVDSIETIAKLYDYVLKQQKSGEIFATKHAQSYWKKGHYSAALKTYQAFLVESKYEQVLLGRYEEDSFNAAAFEFEIDEAAALRKMLSKQKGRDVIRETKVRIGQGAFRKKIMAIYRDTCCVTGLNVPELNRASHIVPWKEGKKSRMDPRNGLCLSGTYDIAFDRYLISLDEDYRIILSPDLREYYTKDVVKMYFHEREGQVIELPTQFKPEQVYLAKHRKLMLS